MILNNSAFPLKKQYEMRVKTIKGPLAKFLKAEISLCYLHGSKARSVQKMQVFMGQRGRARYIKRLPDRGDVAFIADPDNGFAR
ncbi:MAG: hypothetical protein P8O08_21290, partial [Paracoccaceae bacterium]|nr:hypothetical protein [Paracoccaceae bacterium]